MKIIRFARRKKCYLCGNHKYRQHYENVYSRLVTLTLSIATAFFVASCGNRIGEKESMEFLYRYMDIADQGDYSEEFFREM